MPLFYYFQNVAIYWSKICRFSTLLIRHSHIKTWQYIRAFSWDVECKSWFQKPSLLLYILQSLVLTHYQRATDGRTDRVPKSSCSRSIHSNGRYTLATMSTFGRQKSPTFDKVDRVEHAQLWRQCRQTGDNSATTLSTCRLCGQPVCRRP